VGYGSRALARASTKAAAEAGRRGEEERADGRAESRVVAERERCAGRERPDAGDETGDGPQLPRPGGRDVEVARDLGENRRQGDRTRLCREQAQEQDGADASTSSTQMLSWKREPASGSATTPGSACSCAADARRRLTNRRSNLTHAEVSSSKTWTPTNHRRAAQSDDRRGASQPGSMRTASRTGFIRSPSPLPARPPSAGAARPNARERPRDGRPR
jgi:hypothetical protein